MEQGGAASTARVAGVIVGGRYRVESQLGSGSTGVVYSVIDERTGARLALKRLRVGEGPRQARLLAQFEREYHILCQLAHPRIIEVHEYGVDADGAFYTMELLDGQDLRARGQLPWRQACALLRDVASSLAILHSRGLLHRDVSARNVRCTGDGRAKLLDFGAMVPMGAVKDVVGTPPFVPPEALQLQALDARSDLYALGALAHRVLTGRYAYPASEFGQLPELWRSPPPPIEHAAPDVPRPLAQLVAQLLQLDRSARPGSAAEVMERLAGIAGLPIEERAEVTRAYLAMPALVGRDAQLRELRVALEAALQGAGACLLLEGDAGTGRSRMLDAAVLEAKLLGAVVLRADAADAATGEYGVLAALCAQLFRALPELAARHAAPRAELLSCVVAELRTRSDAGHASSPGSGPAPARRKLQAALRDFLLSVARSVRLAIAVDDVEAADEPSAAVLALLVHGVRRRGPSLLLAAERGVHTPALSLLRSAARRIELGPLHAVETEALLGSVFGDVPHVATISRRVHDLALGNPRWVMALAERLVECGVARYEAGAFRLPEALAPGDLPDSLASALAARVAALDSDALELAQALALTDPAVLTLERYPRLTVHGEHARTYRAIDALLAAAVLLPSGDRYRFAQRELVPILQAALEPARQQALHARIALAVQGCDDAALLPHHLLLAGREREAIERLLPLRSDLALGYSAQVMALLDRAIAAAERLGLPTRVRVELLMWMIGNAAMLGEYPRFLRHALPLLYELERASGLHDYQELDAALPSHERWARALALAQARHAAAPDAARGLSPMEAIPHLARLCALFNTMTSIVQDLTLIERVPSLDPLVSLSPGLWVVQQLIESTRLYQAGCYDASGERSLRVLERVNQPDRATLDPVYHKAVRLGVMYVQGSLAALRGQPAVSAWIAELEQDPGYRVNAVRLRMAHELMQGDLDAARESRRRAELLQLEDPGKVLFPVGSNRLELQAYTYAEDVLGVKRALERIERGAALYPSLQITLGIARSVHRRLQGDAAGALALIEPVLAAAEPGRHLDWVFAATTHVNALLALGRAREAVEHATRYLEIARRQRLSPTHRSLMKALAEALLDAGEALPAKQVADECLLELETAGSRGLLLGTVCETRARIAIAMRDAPAFQRFAERTAREYLRGQAAALRARYETLLRQGAAQGLGSGALGARNAAADDGTAGAPSQHSGVRRMLSAPDAGARASEGLRLLLAARSARAGYLYALRDGTLELLAREGDAEPAEVRAMAEGYLRSQLAAESAATAADTAAATPSDAAAYEPLLLVGWRGGEAKVAAVAVLLHAEGERSALARSLLETIASALLEGDDVDPVTWVA